ncbi:hypothetical protein HETIRDRAFT_416040 [Heterobasidion irregulare TC 32-1]|uniref:Uncharacterized protein n=1 Tax=Heterobasidion irregulare (strain TC 32-1) TaxID=747525 RepID=W4KGC0_HETIT|nr:uncharacterized protein HETIRDRAFT_416040 [Heterobasidion irregulare TC 32-1]ETW84340.1 hypothetical protein HETIRDRAFT_416040 [Heterobasidion irregulare TC 32-1]
MYSNGINIIIEGERHAGEPAGEEVKNQNLKNVNQVTLILSRFICVWVERTRS